MKKALTLILALTFVLGVKAQNDYDIAPDFMTRDCHGDTIHLYDILDNGQYVLIHFSYFNPWPICRDGWTTIALVEAFPMYGCNQEDVFFMAITPYNDDDGCQIWLDKYNIKYPMIGTSGGSDELCDMFNLPNLDQLMLIAPSREIVIPNIRPNYDVQHVINALEQHGIEQHECSYGEFLMSTDTVYVHNDNVLQPGMLTFTNTTYFDIQITGYESDDFNVECYDSSSPSGMWNNIVGKIVPSEGSLDVYVFVYPNAKSTTTGTMRFTTSAGVYEVTIVYEDTWGTEELPTMNNEIYPNPADELVTITGANLGVVNVFNVLGQKVADFVANGNELNINTTDYENGIYFVQVGEKVMKFMVQH